MSNSHLMATKNGFVSDTKRMPIRHVYIFFLENYIVSCQLQFTRVSDELSMFSLKIRWGCFLRPLLYPCKYQNEWKLRWKEFFLYFNILRFQASVIPLFLLFTKSKIFFVFDSNLDICMVEWISLWYLIRLIVNVSFALHI